MGEEVELTPPRFVYRALYANRLREKGGLTFREAWTYPLPSPGDAMNPTVDADVEMSYWGED